MAPPRGHSLRQLQRGPAGKRPRRPLLEVGGDVGFFLVTQEVEREPHGGEVDLLQEAEGQTG